MNLDIRTLALLSGFSALLLGIGTLMSAGGSGSYIRGATRWAAGTLLATVGFVFLALRDVVPLLLSVVLGNGFLIGSLLLLDHAISDFESKPHPRLWYALLPLACAAIAFFASAHPSLTARVGIMMALCAFLTGRSGLRLWFAPTASRTRSYRFTALGFLIVAGLQTLRGIDLMLHGNRVTNLFQNDPLYFGLSLLLYTAGTLLSIGFVLMCNERLHIQLKRLAVIDPLTDSYNRRGIYEAVQHEMARSMRTGNAFSLIVLDLDHFKRVNDQFGHDAGDAVLQNVVLQLKKGLRAQDLIGRLGGEEFVVFLPDTGRNDAPRVAERLRGNIEANPVQRAGQVIECTASLGVATFAKETDTYETLIKRCDDALYEAKENGRNRVCFSTPPPAGSALGPPSNAGGAS